MVLRRAVHCTPVFNMCCHGACVKLKYFFFSLNQCYGLECTLLRTILILTNRFSALRHIEINYFVYSTAITSFLLKIYISVKYLRDHGFNGSISPCSNDYIRCFIDISACNRKSSDGHSLQSQQKCHWLHLVD